MEREAENRSVTVLKGVGPKTAAAFLRLGISTIGDLSHHYPVRFEFYPEISPELPETGEGPVALLLAPDAPLSVIRKGRFCLTQGQFSGDCGRLRLVWYNMPYLKKALKTGESKVYLGRIRRKDGKAVLEQPSIFSEEKYAEMTGRPVPVYPLTEGLSAAKMREAVREALSLLPPEEDWLTEEERAAYGLCGEDRAVRGIHFPEDMAHHEEARKRIVFDEFFTFLSGIQTLKERTRAQVSNCPVRAEEFLGEYRELLPFSLTEGQESAVREIADDLSSGRVMNRLLQGDVGSGKTAVAGAALFAAVRNGYQGAIMAPTEVLARQHLKTFEKLFSGACPPVRCVLLTGSMTAAEKRRAREAVESGEAGIVIGTHALIQDQVAFRRLAVVVTDEQHRFGVGQRAALSGKGDTPHTLVMSATPIPRTLAVILYGDLDISAIRSRPAGRLPIKNAVIPREERPKALLHILKEVRAGRQAYIICPLVEKSELLDAENVTDYSKTLRESFRGEVTVGCLHGRMKEQEKQQVMEDFSSGAIQVLVSTTVVEVGVDVPNATVMMIENAERFGLASLHQLRGRVGRGDHQSYCIFVKGSGGGNADERLGVLKRSNDGFEIASEDLKLRGPGQLFGFRQSGELTFHLADLYNDYSVLLQAKELLEKRGTGSDRGLPPEPRAVL